MPTDRYLDVLRIIAQQLVFADNSLTSGHKDQCKMIAHGAARAVAILYGVETSAVYAEAQRLIDLAKECDSNPNDIIVPAMSFEPAFLKSA